MGKFVLSREICNFCGEFFKLHYFADYAVAPLVARALQVGLSGWSDRLALCDPQYATCLFQRHAGSFETTALACTFSEIKLWHVNDAHEFSSAGEPSCSIVLRFIVHILAGLNPTAVQNCVGSQMDRLIFWPKSISAKLDVQKWKITSSRALRRHWTRWEGQMKRD